MKILNILMIISVLFFNSCTIGEEEEKDPKIKVYVNEQEIENNGRQYLGEEVINTIHNNLITIRNTGDKTLEISSITCNNTFGNSFTFFDEYNIPISGNNEEEFGIALFSTFQTYGECRITINSNASNALTFIFIIQANSVNP